MKRAEVSYSHADDVIRIAIRSDGSADVYVDVPAEALMVALAEAQHRPDLAVTVERAG